MVSGFGLLRSPILLRVLRTPRELPLMPTEKGRHRVPRGQFIELGGPPDRTSRRHSGKSSAKPPAKPSGKPSGKRPEISGKPSRKASRKAPRNTSREASRKVSRTASREDSREAFRKVSRKASRVTDAWEVFLEIGGPMDRPSKRHRRTRLAHLATHRETGLSINSKRPRPDLGQPQLAST